MHLIRIPKRPDKAPAIRITIGLRERARDVARLLLLERRARRRVVRRERRAPRPGRVTVGPPAVGDRGRTHHARGRRTSRSIPPCRTCASARSRRASPRPRRPASRVIVPEGLDGGTDRGPHRRAARRDRVRRDRRAARHRRAPRRQPGLRSPRQSLRHLQRIARAAGAGRRSSSSGRTARASRSSATCRTRRRWPSIATAGSTCRAASTAACIASRPTDAPTLYASDLGVACGLAFGPDGALYVGDRSGSILRVEQRRRARTSFATLPPSVAAFHLAFGPDGYLYVTAPTLGTHDRDLSHLARRGTSTPWSAGFGRPQGLAFDSAGHLYVVDALAGRAGSIASAPTRRTRRS